MGAGLLASFGFGASLSAAVGAAVVVVLALTIVIAIASNCITAVILDGSCDLGAVAISTALVTLATFGLASRLPAAQVQSLANRIVKKILEVLPPFATDYLTNAFSD